MQTEGNHRFIKKVFDGITTSNQIHEAVLLIENTSGAFSETFSYNGRDIDSSIILASVTKLFTTACVLILHEQGRLSFDDKIIQYFDKEQLNGLHVLDGREYSYDLTISNLLFQTSGLPDAFEDSNRATSNTMNTILENDTYLTFEESIAETKSLVPRFAPNTGSKAYYSNINFDLLGEILEKITQLKLSEIYKRLIFSPLGLTKTYLPMDKNDYVPYTFYKSQKLERPKLIASCRASGGCVSTARELMIFIKAFWGGKLFDKKIFERLSIYRKIQATKGPIRYGGGYMQIPLDGLVTLFMGKGELLGHSGSTGSFAFYYPQKDLYFVGDLAQLANPAIPIRLVMKLSMTVK